MTTPLKTKALAIETWVLALRGGVNIPITEEDAKFIEKILNSDTKVFRLKQRIIARDAVLYIVPAEDAREAAYRMRGWWQCDQGTWHDKKEKCECIDKKVERIQKLKEERFAQCGKCKQGWILNAKDEMEPCLCWQDLREE